MAALSLVAGAPPVFLSKSWVTKDVDVNGGVFVASKMQPLLKRIYDMDAYSIWRATGSDDSQTETIELQLFEGNGQTTRDIDFVALSNINFKRFKVEYSNDDGATWTIFTGADYTAANYALPDFLISLAAPVQANRLKLTMYTTQIADQEKILGCFIAALATLQTSRPPDSAHKAFVETVRAVTLGDGSQDVTYIRRSAASYEFYSATVNFSHLPLAERDSLRAIKRAGKPFLWVPEPAEVLRDIFLSRMEGAWTDDFTDPFFKGAGYNVAFNIREMSGS